MKLKFNVGDRVFDKKYGHGVVQRVDAGNSEFPYLIFYEDGTKIWYKAKGATLAPAEQQD